MSVDLDEARSIAPRGSAPHAARHLIAVPYRQAGLIALCAFAGAMAAMALSALHAPGKVVDAHVAVQGQREQASPRPSAIGVSHEPSDRAVVRLQLDLDPQPVAADVDASATSVAQAPGAALRLDDAHQVDRVEAYLESSPPAAGPIPVVADERPVAIVAWPGLVAGLFLGLLVAGLRELPGGRMRTPREAEWALGAPVLGAIPTLSAKARAASVALSKRPVDAMNPA